MTHQILADRNCGMNLQAAELLARMSSETIDTPPEIRLSTLPYCNCREMGFVLAVHPREGEQVNMAFYEHRNSDELCVIRWEGRLPISGAVTAKDIPDAVFPDKWSVTASWPYGHYQEAIEYARKVIAEVTADKRAAA